MDIFFSVVIPLYNKEKHIKRAVDSVLAQTYQNFELIVVNDGSTDHSLGIISTYQNHPQVRIISQCNKGECAARNTGIVNARHDFIAFLDADDSWENNFLAEIFDLILSYPGCGIYATSFKRFLPKNKILYHQFKGIPFASNNGKGLIKNLFYSMAKGQDPLTASSVCVPKQVFDDCGLFLEGKKQLQEDVDMWIRIALKYPVAFSGKICANYHCDATNRACLELTLQTDTHPIERTIKNTLKDQNYLSETTKWLEEYLSVIYFSNSIRCMAHNNIDLAKKLLKKVKPKTLFLLIKRTTACLILFLPSCVIQRLLSRTLPPHYSGMIRKRCS